MSLTALWCGHTDVVGRVVLSHVDPLMNTLGPHAASQMDLGDASSVRHHGEVLRCFEILARTYLDQVPASPYCGL